MEPEAAPEDEIQLAGTSVADIPELALKRLKGGLPVDGVRLKAVTAEIQASTRPTGQRVVELYVAHYDNVDAHGEVIAKGAFDDSIAAYGPEGEGVIPFLFDHETLLGPSLEVKPDSKGVFQVGAIDDSPELDKYYQHAKSGAVKRGSIGFLVPKSAMGSEMRDGKRVAVIQRAKMLEGSLVLFPANERAVVVAVKRHAREAAAAAPDGSAAQKSLWSLARALELVASIRDKQSELANIFEGNWWAAMLPEERMIAEAVLAAMPVTAPMMEPERTEEHAAATAAAVIAQAVAPALESGDVPEDSGEHGMLSLSLDRLKSLLESRTAA